MVAFLVVLSVVLLIDAFCYWASVAVDGNQNNFWPFSGYYCLYKTGRKHWNT